jgi:preprotein translocase subunit SecY
MSKDLLNKILITLGFILIYRILAYVPVPGVDISVVKEFFDTSTNSALGMANMFSGNAVERLSIISLGIMPYITASIIMELLAATFPALGKLKKERDGMQKYMQIIRYATIGITFIQAIGVSMGLNSLTGKTGQSAIMIDMDVFIVVATMSMVTGTVLLMWIGEQITQRGIGNGISLIIFAGIVSAIPSAIGGTVDLVNNGQLSFLTVIVILIIILATVGGIIYVELAERRVPVSYSRKVMMQNQNKRIMNYVPIKLNLSGVIPVIFASAILMFPATIFSGSKNEYMLMVADLLNPTSYTFNAIMFLFVVFFAYFYASITFSSKDIAENLKRQGGFIPGVRPGGSTAEFLNETASRLTFWGSMYLGVVSTVPLLIVQAMGVPFYFGGVAVLIVVQVAIDTMRKIEAQQYTNKYETLSATGL